jgi:hypothetical protein
VPGKHPHPVTDPKGHSFGHIAEEIPCPDAAEIGLCLPFRYGVDLFNHGYYWEAHEAWEGVWHACGRQGKLADFLKGLIHLAAAGVKSREGNSKGVMKHAERAKELFEIVGNSSLGEIVERLLANPSTDSTVTIDGHQVLGIWLELEQLTVQ